VDDRKGCSRALIVLCAYVTHADCLRDEMGVEHPECPQRLPAIQDRLLIRGLLDYMVTHDAPLATDEQITRVHSTGHLRELIAMAPSEGYRRVDPDTSMNPFTLTAARRAAGAVVLATDLVIGGKHRRRFAACGRPAIMPNATRRWVSASSTTSRSAFATHWNCTASSAWRCWISTCTTATAAKTFFAATIGC
jgi:hypothetical protein